MNVPAAADTRSRAPLEEKPPTATRAQNRREDRRGGRYSRATEGRLEDGEGRGGHRAQRQGRTLPRDVERETERRDATALLGDDGDADDEQTPLAAADREETPTRIAPPFDRARQTERKPGAADDRRRSRDPSATSAANPSEKTPTTSPA